MVGLFAQVVKELRTEYAAAVASSAERMSRALAHNPGTSLQTRLLQAKNVAAQQQAATAMQQHAMVEALTRPMFDALDECLANLEAALDSRVFVAMARGLWDFIGRDLFEFVENLQVRNRADMCKPPVLECIGCECILYFTVSSNIPMSSNKLDRGNSKATQGDK